MSLVGEIWEEKYEEMKTKLEAENKELREENERLNTKIVDLKAKMQQLAEWANVDVDEDGELVY